MSSNNNTALAKVEGALARGPITKIDDLRLSFDQLRKQRVNIVCPVASIDAILPMHAVSVRAVLIDPSVDGKGNGAHVYKGKFCDTNERALGKVGITMIANAAGVVTLGRRRLDDESDRFYCYIEVTRGFREFDGTWRQETKAKVVDLRDGAPAAEELKAYPAVLSQQRARIQELTETKAGLRADRALLALKQKYSVAELENPFAVPKLVPMLDPSDPDQKRALLDMATGTVAALFGRQPAEASRTTRELPPATEGTSPPPPIEKVGATSPPPVGQTQRDHDDDDINGDQLDLLESTGDADVKICGCPCACQVVVKEETAAATEATFGSIRCTSCAPGKNFDHGRHKDLKTLELAKYPAWTADFVKQQLEKKAAKAAAGR